MLRRSWTIGLAVALAGSMLTGCGGGSKPQPGVGSLFTLIGDSPFCDILSFRTSVTGLGLVAADGGPGATILSSTVTVIKIDFTQLQDFSSILALTSVPQETYNQASIAVSAPQIVLYDPTQSPPIRVVSVTAPATSTSFPVQSPLSMAAGKVSVLQVDLDLQRSLQLQLDAQGKVTGATLAPVVTAAGLASANNSFGEIDDLWGFVRSVSTNSFTAGSTTFAGSMSLQLLSSTISGTGGTAVNLSIPTDYLTQKTICGPVTGSNQACSPVPLNQLQTGSFAEVDGFIDSNGNLVPKSVQLEDLENVTTKQLGFLGYVLTPPTTDSSGNVQFDLFVREEVPDDSTAVAIDSVVAVTAPLSTAYQIAQPANNFANLDFGPTGLTVGQEVVVHGVFTVPTPPPAPATPPLTTVAADKIYLKLQTHMGNFASLIQAGSDDRTGAFLLTPCASIFQGAPIYIITDAQTNFVNVSGLSALTPRPSLLVKGLLVREPQGASINGVSVPAGALVLLAKQVHQTA